MRKILRMFLVMVLATIGFNANAGTIVFADLGLENGVQYTSPFDGGDFTVQFVGGGNDGKYYNTGSAIRMYGDGIMKLGAKSGSITKVIVTWDSSNKPTASNVVNVGTYDVESGIWTGKSDSVFFTRPTGTGHWRVKKLEVTVEGSSIITVPTPSISGTTPFTESTEVTISTPEGGKTYYTTDGSAPTSSSTEYTGPFTISETTTVKAISYDKDGNASSVASKTFEKVTITKVANIKEFKALENDVLAELTLTNAQVLYVNDYSGKELFVRDATGAVDLYKLGIDAKAGDILNGTIIGKRGAASGFKIAMNKDNSTDISTVTVTSGSEPSPIEIAIATAGDNICDYGVLKEATIEANGSNKTAVIGAEKLALYDRFQLKLLNDLNTDGSTYNLYGLLYDGGSYGIELVVTKVELVKEGQVAKVSEINEFISQEQGKAYELALNNAQVVYSWTSDSGNTQAFVRDDSGAICFYFTKPDESLAANFTTNKMLNGSIIMNNTLYNGLPEATVTSETNTEKLTFTDGSEAQPIKITAAEVSKNLNDLVLLENVTITENEGKYYVDDVQVHNGFHFDAFNDLSSFVGEGKTIKGIAFVNNTTYRILPIEITSQGGGETPQGTDKTWNFSEWEIQTISETKTIDGLTVVATADASVAIDSNDKTVDDVKYTQRLKLGGTGSTDSRILKFDVTGACTIKIILQSSSSGADRTLLICKDTWDKENPLATMSAPGAAPASETYKYTGEAGTIIIGSQSSGINLYAIYVTYGSSGIQNVVKPVVENGIRYNLAGQRVDENYKGVVIMNGKKYVVK